MATVIPISLPELATQILRVISLYPMIPAFQNTFDYANYPVFIMPENLTRDTSITSFGFPHSVDSPFAIVDPPNVFSLPANSYAYVLPSFLSGQAPNPITDSYTVLLIDVDIAPIEPGLSRLRVDYLDQNNNPQVTYLDMLQFPKWNMHPRELEEIVEFTEESIDFLQKEIDIQEKDVLQVLNRMQLKGLSVTGQLVTTISTNVQPPIPAQMLSFVPKAELTSKFIQLKLAQRPAQEFKKSIGYTITESPSAVYAGVPFNVVMSQNINQGDTLFINGFPLTTISASGNTFTTQLPSSANMTYDFSLYVVNKGKVLTPSVVLPVYGLPQITNLSVSSSQFANIGDTIFINGINFGYNLGTVTFSNAVSATIESWSPNSVSFTVPNNVVSGYCVLSTSNNKTTEFLLNINAPTYTDTFAITPVMDLITGGQTVSYSALYNGNPVSPNWSIEDATGNLGAGTIIHGFINSEGTFTAPISAAYTYGIGIVANYISNTNKLYSKASLTISIQPSTLTISPSAVLLEPSFTQPYKVYNNGVRVDSDVVYYINGVFFGNAEFGLITQGGLYQAPSVVPNNQTLTIEAIYNGQSAFGTIRIVPLGTSSGEDLSQVSEKNVYASDASYVIDEAYYRSVAYQNSGASNSYYGAPGVLTPISGYSDTFYGNMPGGQLGNSTSTGSNFGAYLGQATDSNGKRCLVLMVGEDYYNSSVISGMFTGITLNASGGSLSNNVSKTKASIGYLTWLSNFANTLQNMDSLLSAYSYKGVNFESPADDAFTFQSQSAGTAGTFPGDYGYIGNLLSIVTMSGYYRFDSDFQFITYNNNQSLPIQQYVSSNGGALPDVLTDLITTSDGTSFYRSIVYISNSVTSVTISAMQGVSGLPGYQDPAGYYRSVSLTSSDFSGNGILNLNPPTPPPPQITSIVSGNSSGSICPGQVVNINGTYFPSNAQAYFSGNNNNEILPRTGAPSSSDGIHYILSVTIPTSIPTQQASYSVKIIGSTGISNTNVSLALSNNCTLYPLLLTVTPANSTLLATHSQQMYCTLQIANGTTQSVTSSVTWYINNIQSGNSTYGTINSNGLYQAPASVPSINPVSIKATYNDFGQPLTGSTGLDITPLPVVIPPPPPPLVSEGCYMLRVSPDNATITVPGPSTQFTAQMYINNANPQTVNAIWRVNDIQNGNAIYGTIDETGLYVPPLGYVPFDFKMNTVSAAYTAVPAPPENAPLDLIGYSVITYDQTVTTSGVCQVTVGSQININFGDGRNGFIPVGTSISLEPGQYLFATYNETLDTYFRAFVNGSSQQMPMTFDSAQANDLSYRLYNEGTLSRTSGTGLVEAFSNVYSQPYTVVLGICDPTSGRFQSMWDLVPFEIPIDNTIATQTDLCVFTHEPTSLEETKESPIEKPKAITDFIEEKINKPIEINDKSVVENLQTICTGSVNYKGGTLNITTPIKIIQFNSSENKFDIVFTSKQENIEIPNNSVLYYNENDLKIVKFGEKIDPDTIIIGVVIDNFYSTWNFLKITNEIESIDNKNITHDGIIEMIKKFGKEL